MLPVDIQEEVMSSKVRSSDHNPLESSRLGYQMHMSISQNLESLAKEVLEKGKTKIELRMKARSKTQE